MIYEFYIFEKFGSRSSHQTRRSANGCLKIGFPCECACVKMKFGQQGIDEIVLLFLHASVGVDCLLYKKILRYKIIIKNETK